MSGAAWRRWTGAVLLALATAACDEATAPRTGKILAEVTTSGGAFDLDGFGLLVDGDSVATVDVNGLVERRVEEGSHWVALGGLAPNCFASTVQPVTVEMGAQARVAFTAVCVPAPELSDLRILFESPDGIVTMNADGTDRAVLIPGAGLHAPDVTSDGTRIAYALDRSGGSDLWVADVDGTDRTTLVAGQVQTPRWSPSDDEIVYVDNGGIAVTSRDGASTVVLLEAEDTGWYWYYPLEAWYSGPTWSPDGSRIAVGSSGGSIVVIARDVPGWQTLTSGRSPLWSPDDRIAYLGFSDVLNGTSYEKDIKSVRPDATDVTTLLVTALPPNPTTTVLRDWSPDGRFLVYSIRGFQRGPDIYLLDVEEGTVVRLTADGKSSYPVFLPSAP